MELFFVGLSVLPLALVVLLVGAIAVGRGEPDPTGRRVHATYLFVVIFVTLIVVIIAASATVGGIVSLASDQSDPVATYGAAYPDQFGTAYPDQYGGFDSDAQDWRTILQSLAIGLVALGILVFHARLAQGLLRENPDETGVVWRVYRVYLHAACLVAVLAALFAAANAVYALIRLVAPGLTALGEESAERDDAARLLAMSGFIAVVAAFAFIRHWRLREGSAGSPPPEERMPEATSA